MNNLNSIIMVTASFIGASLSEPHTSVIAFVEVVCMYVRLLAAIYRKFKMSAFKYFMKTERPRVV